MKYLLLFSSLLLLLASCSDGVMADGNGVSPAERDAAAFSYAAVLGSSQWNSCTSFKQRMQLCQIPDSLLPSLSTAELVELCASHPLNAVCYAYNNPMDGAKVIMSNFNGFAELQKRSDAGQEVLRFYEGIDFADVKNTPYPITLTAQNGNEYSASSMAFMELMMASGEIPALYTDKKLMNELDQLSAAKFEQKAARNDVFSTVSMSPSLMIQTGIALQTEQVNAEERAELQEFYDKGGMSDVSGASKILFLNH